MTLTSLGSPSASLVALPPSFPTSLWTFPSTSSWVLSSLPSLSHHWVTSSVCRGLAVTCVLMTFRYSFLLWTALSLTLQQLLLGSSWSIQVQHGPKQAYSLPCQTSSLTLFQVTADTTTISCIILAHNLDDSCGSCLSFSPNIQAITYSCHSFHHNISNTQHFPFCPEDQVTCPQPSSVNQP